MQILRPEIVILLLMMVFIIVFIIALFRFNSGTTDNGSKYYSAYTVNQVKEESLPFKKTCPFCGYEDGSIEIYCPNCARRVN